MPSVFSHAIAAVAVGGVAVGRPSRPALWGLGAICAVVPDLDVISFHVGLPYDHVLGHRGFSHSLLFAAGLASIMTVLVRRTLMASPSGARLWAFFFLTTASHGVLDALTNGGLGVEFFGPRGLRVMWSELGWIWAPSAVVFLAGLSKWGFVARHWEGRNSHEIHD